MSLLFVDSGCDLSYNHIKMLGIDCINIPYLINDTVLSFSEDFDYEKWLERTRFEKFWEWFFLPLRFMM